jgi:hypothetical protein
MRDYARMQVAQSIRRLPEPPQPLHKPQFPSNTFTHIRGGEMPPRLHAHYRETKERYRFIARKLRK